MQEPRKSELNMCNQKMPKNIRYDIANRLSFRELKNLCKVNKKCKEMCNDDQYWRYRIQSKLASIPSFTKNGNHKQWYIDNVMDIYGMGQNMYETLNNPNPIHKFFNENEDIQGVIDQPILLLENTKYIYFDFDNNNNKPIYYIIDSYGNLGYIIGTFDKLETKIISADVLSFVKPLKMDNEYNTIDTILIYLDVNENLILHDKEKIIISENVKDAKLFYALLEDDLQTGYLYITMNDNKLFVIKDMDAYIGQDYPKEMIEDVGLIVKKFVHDIGDYNLVATDELDYKKRLLYIDMDDQLFLGDKLIATRVKNAYPRSYDNDDGENNTLDVLHTNKNNTLFLCENVLKGDNKKCELLKYDIKSYHHDNVNNYELFLHMDGNLVLNGSNGISYVLNNEIPEYLNDELVMQNVDNVFPSKYPFLVYSMII